MKIITFKITDDLLEQLDRYCRWVGIPRSEVIRQALQRMLAPYVSGKGKAVKVRVRKVILT